MAQKMLAVKHTAPISVAGEKDKVVSDAAKKLADVGAVNLNAIAAELSPFRASMSDADKAKLGESLISYFLSATLRGQFKDLDGMEKLAYVLESVKVVPDPAFLGKLRQFYREVGSYRAEQIFRKKDEERKMAHLLELSPAQAKKRSEENEKEAIAALQKLLPNEKVDSGTLKELAQCAQLLFTFDGRSANLAELSDENPPLAANIVILCERLAGEELQKLRQMLSPRAKQLLGGVSEEARRPFPSALPPAQQQPALG